MQKPCGMLKQGLNSRVVTARGRVRRGWGGQRRQRTHAHVAELRRLGFIPRGVEVISLKWGRKRSLHDQICVLKRSFWLLCRAPALVRSALVNRWWTGVCVFAWVNMHMILERPRAEVPFFKLGPVSLLVCVSTDEKHSMLETQEDETSPGDDGNSPDANPNSGKNADRERSYCLKLGFGNISVKHLLPVLFLLRAWRWFLPPASPDFSSPASPSGQ